MGSLFCCYKPDFRPSQYTKEELLSDNIILSYKVVGLKKQKICTLCMKLLEDRYNNTCSTSRERKSQAETYGTASCRV